MSPLESEPVLVVLDLIGIFVFAISGALVAVRKELDVFGVLSSPVRRVWAAVSCATS